MTISHLCSSTSRFGAVYDLKANKVRADLISTAVDEASSPMVLLGSNYNRIATAEDAEQIKAYETQLQLLKEARNSKFKEFEPVSKRVNQLKAFIGFSNKKIQEINGDLPWPFGEDHYTENYGTPEKREWPIKREQNSIRSFEAEIATLQPEFDQKEQAYKKACEACDAIEDDLRAFQQSLLSRPSDGEIHAREELEPVEFESPPAAFGFGQLGQRPTYIAHMPVCRFSIEPHKPVADQPGT